MKKLSLALYALLLLALLAAPFIGLAAFAITEAGFLEALVAFAIMALVLSMVALGTKLLFS